MVTVVTDSSTAAEIQLQGSLKGSSRNSCLLVTVTPSHAWEATSVASPRSSTCLMYRQRPSSSRVTISLRGQLNRGCRVYQLWHHLFKSAIHAAFQKQTCHLVIYKVVFGMDEGFRAQPKWLHVWCMLFLLSSLDGYFELCRVAQLSSPKCCPCWVLGMCCMDMSLTLRLSQASKIHVPIL